MTDNIRLLVVANGTSAGRQAVAALRAAADTPGLAAGGHAQAVPGIKVTCAAESATASRADAVLYAVTDASAAALAGLADAVRTAHPVPVIALVAEPDDALECAALNAGAHDCVVAATASAATLRRVVTRIVSLVRTQAQLARTTERLCLVARAAGALMWECDLATGHMAYGESVPAGLGYTVDQLPTSLAGWFDIIHPDDRAAAEREWKAAIAGGRDSCAVECRLLRPDGGWSVVSDCGWVVRGPDGAPIRLTGALTDISRTAESDTALRKSEARLRLITDTIRTVFYLAETRPLRMLYLSPAFASIWGVKEEDIYDPETRRLGADVLERFMSTVYAEDHRRVRADIARRVRGEEVHAEYRIVRGDGELRWIGDRSYPLPGPGGEIEQIVGIAEDITDRVHAAQELRRSEEHLSRIVETVMDAIVIVDAEGRITFANRAIEVIAGMPRSDIIGKSLLDPQWQFLRLDGTPLPPHELPAFRVAETGEPVFGAQCVFVQPDGTEVVLSLNAAPLRGPDGTVTEVVASIRDVSAERRAADRVTFQASLLDAVGEAVTATDLAGRITYWNRQAERYSGWTAAEVEGRSILDFVSPPDTRDQFVEVLVEVASGRRYAGEHRIIRRDGSTYPAVVTGTPIRDESGAVIGLCAASTDLTDMKRLEEQLQQAQRMEAVGRLAGGVAHDFNNILTSIKGYTHFMLEELSASDPMRADAEEIAKSADRAAGLTRQLLAFSRKQVLQPRVLDLGAVVGRMERMLLRLIGEDVELTYTCDRSAARVLADPGQIEQVVLNLAVNARDAMPSGGQLHIEVENERQLDATSHAGWVVLRVTDTGVGISSAALPFIFEPFFTTKGTGQGTGLGLSTVYGIVTQTGGTVQVRSTEGMGTVFEIRLPRAAGPIEEPELAAAVSAASRGETILIVEDEDSVRSLAARTLRRAGYDVLQAQNGGEALLLCERHDGPIHLLLTDVVMPRMSGREVAERLVLIRPGMQVLFMSGYTADVIARHGILEEGQLYLEKPFTPAALAARVREVIDGASAQRGAPENRSSLV